MYYGLRTCFYIDQQLLHTAKVYWYTSGRPPIKNAEAES